MKIAVTADNPTLSYQFDCQDDGIIGVYGVSGSGKSSLLDILAGFKQDVRGFIEFNGKVLLDTQNKLNNKVRKCAYLQQHPLFFAQLHLLHGDEMKVSV